MWFFDQNWVSMEKVWLLVHIYGTARGENLTVTFILQSYIGFLVKSLHDTSLFQSWVVVA